MNTPNRSRCNRSERREHFRSSFQRRLHTETLESRRLLAVDLDDSISESIPMGQVSTSPVTRSGSISPADDVDMYQITGFAGQSVDIDIDTQQNGVGGLGNYLRLFNSSGQQIAFSDDANAPGEDEIGFDAYLRYTFATTDMYYIGVSNFNNITYDATTGDGDVAGGDFATGDYQLTVGALADDVDDEISEAIPLGFVGNTALGRGGEISTDVDVDMYSFSVEAGQVVDFDIDTATNGEGGLGSYLRLFNEQGQELAFNDDANAPGEDEVGFDAYLRYQFANSGQYFIAVSNLGNANYDPRSGDSDAAGGFFSTGEYQLTIQSLADDQDDEFTEAELVGRIDDTPNTFSASIDPDTDVDLYRFSVSAGQTVDFDIDTEQNGAGGLGSFIRLFDSTGRVLATNDDAAAPGESSVGFDAYLRYQFENAGTYYLGVSNLTNVNYDPQTGEGDTSGGLNAIGDYQLTISSPIDNTDDLDDTIAEAVSLGLVNSTPNTVSSEISPDVDVDIYSFTVVAGQTVDFDIDTVTNGGSGLGSYLRLFNANGQQLSFNDDAAAPGETIVGFDAYLRYTFDVGGTYFVAVSNASNTSFNPQTGDGDVSGGTNAVGNYTFTVNSIDQIVPQLVFTIQDTAVAESGGRTIGRIQRIDGNNNEAITVTLTSSDAQSISVPANVVIPANQDSVTFEILAVADPQRGTRQAVISASAQDIETVTQTISVVDNDRPWQNEDNAADTNNDGSVTPLDALLVINYLNSAGSGPVPTGDPFPFYDVNGDNFVSPVDVLLVIRELNNRRGNVGGEGEQSFSTRSLNTTLPSSTFQTYSDLDRLARDRQDALWSQSVDEAFSLEMV